MGEGTVLLHSLCSARASCACFHLHSKTNIFPIRISTNHHACSSPFPHALTQPLCRWHSDCLHNSDRLHAPDLPLRDIAPVTNAATSATQRVGVVPGSSIATLDTKESVVTCSFPEHPPTDMPTFNSTGASGEKDVEELYELPAVAQTIIDQKKARAISFHIALLECAAT
eukprot:SAG31_NODE_579_length_13948_cov_5.599105_15_plen_170_part_00